MCDSTMLCGDGQFSPITITEASVFELRNDDGKIVGYQFMLE